MPFSTPSRLQLKVPIDTSAIPVRIALPLRGLFLGEEISSQSIKEETDGSVTLIPPADDFAPAPDVDTPLLRRSLRHSARGSLRTPTKSLRSSQTSRSRGNSSTLSKPTQAIMTTTPPPTIKSLKNPGISLGSPNAIDKTSLRSQQRANSSKPYYVTFKQKKFRNVKRFTRCWTVKTDKTLAHPPSRMSPEALVVDDLCLHVAEDGTHRALWIYTSRGWVTTEIGQMHRIGDEDRILSLNRLGELDWVLRVHNKDEGLVISMDSVTSLMSSAKSSSSTAGEPGVAP